MDKGMVILKELITGKANYYILRIVPRDLRNIVFITFHTNSIEGHRSLNATIFLVPMHFFLSEIYSYCKKLITKYAGYKMANAVNNPKKQLVYNFPLGVPMTVLHVDGYLVGANINFSGDKGFLIAACGMCTFVVVELDDQALLMIML